MDARTLHSLLKSYNSNATASSIPQPDVEVFFYYNNLHIIEGLARVAFINPGGGSFNVPTPPPVVPARWNGTNPITAGNTADENEEDEENNDSSGSDNDEGGDVRKQVEPRTSDAQGVDHVEEDELDSAKRLGASSRSSLPRKNGRNNRRNWTVYAAVETHHPLPLLFMRPVAERKRKPPLTPQPSKAPSTVTAQASVQFNSVLADIHEPPLIRNNSQRLLLLNPNKYNVTYVAPAPDGDEEDHTLYTTSSNTASAVHVQRRMSLINNTWASSPALPDPAATIKHTNGHTTRNMRPTPIPSNFPATSANSINHGTTANGGLLQRQNTGKFAHTTNNYYDLTRQNSRNIVGNAGGQQQRQQRRASIKPAPPSPPRFGPFRAFHMKKHNMINGVQQPQTAANGLHQQPLSSVNGGGGFGSTYDDVHTTAALSYGAPRLQASPSNGANYYPGQPLLSVSPLLSGNIGYGGNTASVYTERGIFGLVEELSLPPAADAPAPPKPEPLLRTSSTNVKQSGSRGSILLMQSRMRGRRMSKPSILNQLIARSECRAGRFGGESSSAANQVSSGSTAAFRTTPQVKAIVEQPFLIVTMFGSTQSETASKRFEDNWFNTTLAHYVLNNIPKTFRLRCVRFLRRKTTFLTAPLLNAQQNGDDENDMLTNYYAGGSGYYQQQQQLQLQQRMQSIQYICTIEVIPTASSILASAVNLKIDLSKQNECELLREILTAELLNFVIKLRAFYVGIVGVYERVQSKPRSESNRRRGAQQPPEQQHIQEQNPVPPTVHHHNPPRTPSPTSGPTFIGKHNFSSLLAERRHSSISSAGSGWQMLRRRNSRSRANADNNNFDAPRGSVESLGGCSTRKPARSYAQQQQQYGGSAMHIDSIQPHQQHYYNNPLQKPTTLPMYLMRSDQQIYGPSAGPHGSSRMVHASPTLTAMYVEDERSPFGGSLMQRLAAAKRQEQKAKQLQRELQQQAQKKKTVPASVPIGLRRLDSDGAGSDNDSERRHRAGGAAPWAFPFYGGKWKIRTPQ